MTLLTNVQTVLKATHKNNDAFFFAKKDFNLLFAFHLLITFYYIRNFPSFSNNGEYCQSLCEKENQETTAAVVASAAAVVVVVV